MDQQVFIPVITGILSFVAGLLTPWLKWNLAKRDELQIFRRGQIDDWRMGVGAVNFFDPDAVGKFKTTAIYASMRANLPPTTFERLEARLTVFKSGPRGPDVLKQDLLDGLAEQEKVWKLI